MFRRIMTAIATGVLLAGAGLAGGGAAEAKPAETNGCGNGVVCLYTDSGWQNHTPQHTYWTYGVSNLNNESGQRVLFNNQRGGAVASLCTKYNGGGSCTRVEQGRTWRGNITPINSIVLSKS
ncbi:hypothetical protein ELQ87_07665 [Streptomyces griseoviridis]|uniref:Peptidase inhibitor n=2 Tax=Streptomyces TaxID=1883 RepID=A0A3Q9KTP6_STRGD|nr:hypothetical protein [Streptomyces griseoviridis]AZS84177.1 hypothetical protein ELQ87_07665 [Streptomyces griseoviridis]MDH6697100.1 hypothetical protein [Streptomyces sp. MAA16]